MIIFLARRCGEGDANVGIDVGGCRAIQPQIGRDGKFGRRLAT